MRRSSFRSSRESIVYSAASTAAIDTASQSATRKSISFSSAAKLTRSLSSKGVRHAPMIPLIGLASGISVQQFRDDSRHRGGGGLLGREEEDEPAQDALTT